MAGLFAHFVIAEMAIYSKLFKKHGLKKLQVLLLTHSNYVLLGANSPDLPYPSEDNIWGDHMHYDKTGEFIQNAIDLLKTMSGSKKKKCFAWLLGYVAHLASDTVIHPVVNMMVPPYNVDPAPHQLCEKYQDVFAFNRLNLGETTNAEYISSTIVNCKGRDGKIDSVISQFWASVLTKTFPESGTPNIANWYKDYIFAADKGSEEGGWWHIRAVARIKGVEQLLQVEFDEIDFKYINNIPSPEGLLQYDDVLDRAIKNTENAWLALNDIVSGKATTYPLLSNWNLDSGENESGKHLFWNVPKPSSKRGGVTSKILLSLVLLIILGLAYVMHNDPTMIFENPRSKLPTLGTKVINVSKVLYAKHSLSPLSPMENEKIQQLIQKLKPEYKEDFALFYLSFDLVSGGSLYVWSSPSKDELYIEDILETPKLDKQHWQKHLVKEK